MTRVSASAVLLPDKDEHAVMVRNVSFVKENETSPATVTTIERGKNGTVGSTLDRRIEKCSVLYVRIKGKVRKIRNEYASQAAAVNQHKT